MKKEIGARVIDKILPYFVFPTIVGAVTGALIFLFKLASSWVMHESQNIYSFVRQNPIYLPLLMIAVTLIGAVSALLLKWAKECRGGGIPTAIATIRGLIPMKWAQCIFGVFGSSMLTYAAGVPLGNEGPSVQMGAAVGKGVSYAFGKKNRAWSRYNMTGGASAGFAIATGSPLAGIIFAVEELHRRFSPPVIIVASVSVLSGTVTSRALSDLFNVDTTFLDLAIDKVLPFRYLWIAVLIGIVCGICANLLTRIYYFVKRASRKASFDLPYYVKIAGIFLVTAVLGFASADFVGSGHSVIEHILEGRALWYIMLIAFAVRSILMLMANNNGVTGGLFVPTLSLGAIIASLVSDAMIALGAIGAEYYPILIVIGIASFLSASSRIPLTALTFAAESLCVVSNMLPAAVGVIISYLVVEILGVPCFTDTVIETKVHDACRDKTPIVVDSHMTVQHGAFAVGMEVRDILWPPTCTILSITKGGGSHKHAAIISEGDIIHLHYRTYDPADTISLLTDILGEQPEDGEARIHTADDGHHVPGD